MVILGRKFGRLANRLWVFTNFAANAIEHGYALSYRNFDEYIEYFEAPSTNDFDGYPIKFRLSKNKLLDRLRFWKFFLWYNLVVKKFKSGPGFSFIETTPSGKAFHLYNPKYLKLACDEKQNLYVGHGGFWFMDNENTIKHKEIIKKFLRPKKEYQEIVEQFISKCRKTSDCLVGIHLRKGDYRRFEDGKNFYEDEVYYHQMKYIANMLGERGKTSLFILCSDEPINQNAFKGLPTVAGPGHLITDLYAFAECDYLLGPPSSYTLWASFYGDVPLKFLMKKETDYALSDFQLVKHIGDAFTMQGREF